MTVREAAMVGCDEGKATASARAGGRRRGCVPGRCVSPPAKTDGQAAADAQSLVSDRRGRLADVGGHCDLAVAADRQPALAGDRVRASSAEGLHRTRSRATWPSSWRRMAVRRAIVDRAGGRISLTFGTNRELSGDGLSRCEQGAVRPALTAGCPARRSSSRRQQEGQQTRRRDARPIRSGGRRGLGSGGRGASYGRLRLAHDADVVKIGAQLGNRYATAAQAINGDRDVGSDASTILEAADMSFRAKA